MGFEAKSSFETYAEVKAAVNTLPKTKTELLAKGLLLDSNGGYTYGKWADPITGTIPINTDILKEGAKAIIIFSGSALVFSGSSVLFRTNIPDAPGVYEVGVMNFGEKICVYVPNAEGAPPLGDLQAPTSPQNLEANNVINTALDLSWDAATDNVGVTGYDIYQNGIFLVSTTNTNFTVTGLTPSTSYSYFVKAKDAIGNESINSNTINVATSSGAGGVLFSTPVISSMSEPIIENV